MMISVELVKQLREETGAGVLECRKTLEQANADYGRALGLLRERGLKAAAKKADRPALQGSVEVYSHGNGRLGVLVEINTETDFAARSSVFRSFAHEIALQIAASAPLYVRDEDIPAAVLEQEAREAEAQARAAGKPTAVIEKILAGTLEKYKDRAVLLRQAYIRDESLTVAQLLQQTVAAVGENVVIRRFLRWELDGGIENRE
jgi:elongation factor Ts